MTAKQIVEQYLQKVKEKGDWQTFIADDIRFESPAPTTVGKEGYVTGASRFFQIVETLAIKHIVAEGDKVSVWIDYSLRMPSGKTSHCLVAELLQVRNEKIVFSSILFDTLALKEFTSGN
jgi:hypothetical protein